MDKNTSKVVVLALIVLSLFAIYFLYYANSISLIVRIIGAFALLIVVGMIIQRLFEFNGSYGLYMVGSKKGLKTIDDISKHYKIFWEVMAVWGLTLGFGLLTYPLLKGKMDKRVYAFGVVSIILILLFVMPYIANTFQFINLPQLQNAISSAGSQTSPNYLLTYVSTAITIIAGFSGSVIFSLALNTELILYSIVTFITNPSLGVVGSGLTSQIPGAAPIIPGIDIALIPGIIALALLLIIHEFSHGILARDAKVKLKSMGLLIFGFIPIGGFVEPDEKQVNKLDRIKQTNIFSAGTASNFVATIVFFVLVFLFITFIIPSAIPYKVVVLQTSPNYPANNVLQKGMQILKWNNHTISNISSLTAAASSDRPNGTVVIVTNTGTYSFKAVASPSNSSRGIIGVSLGYSPVVVTPYQKVVYFLYTLFSLSLLINFLVAVVNLLPIPVFDGYRIYTTNIKNKKLVNTLAALIVIMILINVLPLFFYYL